MTYLSHSHFKRANEAAVYNIFLYLSNKINPTDQQSLKSIINSIKQANYILNERDIYRFNILKNAIKYNPFIANSKIGNYTFYKNGLTSCTFTNPDREIFVIFKGTGSGEWIDNGEGLSGIPEENTYITYGKYGKELFRKTIDKDYATDQQVEALNWFNRIASKNSWNENSKIILSGHSKGGNKAQFITIHSNIVNFCYSFDGQGFSPESIEDFKIKFKKDFEIRRQKIFSISADNDYVNVLGNRLMPKSNIHYFKSYMGFHYMEAILDSRCILRDKTEQGKLSLYIEQISKEIMEMKPSVRKYATLGIMNIFQKYFGKGTPVNQDYVSVEETVAGLTVALVPFLRNLMK